MKSWHERCLQSCLFLCSIRQPFLRPDRALLLRRRAQTPSRSAVAQTTPQCPTSRGRTLDGGEHGGRLAWVGQKTIRRSGTAKLEPAMLSPPSQLCAHGCIVPSSRSGLLYSVWEWEWERERLSSCPRSLPWFGPSGASFIPAAPNQRGRAQRRSRPAAAPWAPHAPTPAGRVLTAASTAARSIGSGRSRAVSTPPIKRRDCRALKQCDRA